MTKFIKRIFNRKTKLTQQEELCNLLDSYQSKAIQSLNK